LTVTVPTSARRLALAVALITGAAFLLRLSQMQQSLYGDEVWTYGDVVGRSLGSVLRTVHTGGENSPPLFFVLAWLSAKLGDPTVWIRLPSLILGMATLPLVYLLGRETIGRTAGLIGVAVVAASPFSIYYGIEARPYATMAFFVTLSTFALVRAVRGGSRRWWALYVLAAAAAAYTHYTSIFVLGTQAVWSIWACRDRLREPLIAGGVVTLLYVPWLPHLRGKQLGVIGFLEPLNLHNVLVDLGRPIAGYPYAPLHAIPTIPGLAALAVCALAGAIPLASRRLQARGTGPRDSSHFGLITALAIATPVGLLLYSLLATDLWLARGLYASVPAAALLLGALLTALPRRLRIAAVTVVMATLIFGTVRAISPQWARPPYRAIASYLDRVARPRDPVILESFIWMDIPVHFHKPHVLSSSPSGWRTVRHGGIAYVLLDDRTAQALKVGLPHPQGFQLVAHAHYGGIEPTELLTYVRR
jgi:uncharacterized membrane protein